MKFHYDFKAHWGDVALEGEECLSSMEDALVGMAQALDPDAKGLCVLVEVPLIDYKLWIQKNGEWTKRREVTMVTRSDDPWIEVEA